MRLLVLNPNISDEVTALIRAEAQRTASPGTEMTVLTAPFGVAYIETRMEAAIGAYALLQMAAEHADGHDAVVVAAFGDPGADGLRELLPIPVVGMTQAALASAHLLGRRFSIVAISQRIALWYRETVHAYGFSGRMASLRSLDRPLSGPGSVQQEHRDRLLELCDACVRQDGAEVIVLAGAPLAGLARSVAGQIAVPVVDGVSSAIRHAESLVVLQPGAAKAGSFSMPPAKAHKGLPSAIARRLDAPR